MQTATPNPFVVLGPPPFGRNKKAFSGSAANTRIQVQAVHTAPPNPSIERTLSGLRPPSASHVKR